MVNKRTTGIIKILLSLSCGVSLLWVIWVYLPELLSLNEGIETTLSGGLSILVLLIFTHYAIQTWRNAGPRDRCKSCSKRQPDETDLANTCFHCGELPNQRRSVWAFWKVVTTPTGRWLRLVRKQIHRRSIQNKQIRGLCVHCGYDLYGNTSATCPECGKRNS